MKRLNILRPVKEWFKTVGQVAKEPHASDAGPSKPEVIKSPPKKEKKR